MRNICKIWKKDVQLFRTHSFTKGQLISKCPFGFIVWTKLPTKLFLNFCPEIFCTFLGASWKLFGASCRLPCLWYYILSPQEAQRASMKPPGSYKKNSGQKSRNNFVGIFVQTMKPKGHFEINWPLVDHDFCDKLANHKNVLSGWQLCIAMMSWVRRWVKFVFYWQIQSLFLFAENSQILLKISVIPILLTFIYLIALDQ